MILFIIKDKIAILPIIVSIKDKSMESIERALYIAVR